MNSLGNVNSYRLASLFIQDNPHNIREWVEAQRMFLLGKPAERVLEDLYYEFSALGWLSSRHTTIEEVKRKAAGVVVDWEGWTPGNPEAAKKLLGDTPGLRELLAKSRITLKGIRDTRVDDLSRILGNAQASGEGYKQTAKIIQTQFKKSPVWAKMVARTEGRRATTAASLDFYQAAEIEQVEWLTAWNNACEECSDYEGMGPVLITEGFGDIDGPPAHPNCLCVVIPVVGTGTVIPAERVEEEEVEEPVIEGEPEIVTEPTVEPDGFYDRESWPEWAKESGLADVIDELPVDRADIGMRMQTKEELIREWEQKNSGTFTSLEDLEKAKIAAEKKLPKAQKELESAETAFQNYWNANPELQSRVGGLTDDRYDFDISRQFPEYYNLKDQVRFAEIKETDLRSDLRRWQEAQDRIAEAKQMQPDWESTLVPARKADIDEVTGKPGSVLMGHLDSVKRAGDIIENEVQQRLPESMRGTPERSMNPDELKIIRDTRMQVVSEIRPMDTGADMFRPLSDSEARVAAGRGSGVGRAPSQEMIELIQPSLDHYPSSWIDSMRDVNPEVKLLAVGRGFNSQGAVIAISGTGDRGLSTFVHEIGHSAERSVDGLKRLEWAELWNRSVKPTGKLPGLVSIYGSSSEKVFSGHRFNGAYTGKLYGTVKDQVYYISRDTLSPYQSNFEVFTTGMQASFPRTQDDVTYGDDDGGFQRFILGALTTL